MNHHIQAHILEHASTLEALSQNLTTGIEEIGLVLIEAIKKNKLIMWCGNGGSASDSQHLSAELVGRFNLTRDPLRSVSLNSDTSVLTCISNDFSFENVFARQVQALAELEDILIVISTSGRSPNIIRALETAKEKKVITIGLLGKDGGGALAYCDYSLVVPSLSTARIQEMHIMIGHILCDLVDKYYQFKEEDLKSKALS